MHFPDRLPPRTPLPPAESTSTAVGAHISASSAPTHGGEPSATPAGTATGTPAPRDYSNMKNRLLKLVPNHPSSPHYQQKILQLRTAWHNEQNAGFDQQQAIALQRQAIKGQDAQGNPVDIDQLARQWQAGLPALEMGEQDSNWKNRMMRNALHPRRLPILEWFSAPATAANAIKAEVDDVLAQNDWKPVLASNIANSPEFSKIYAEMQETQIALRSALDTAREAHRRYQAIPTPDRAADAEAETRYHSAMEELARHTTKASRLCMDHEMATGLVYKAGVGNLGSISVNVLQGVAAAALAPVAVNPAVAPAISLAFDLASDPARQSDLSRSNDIVARLNLQYANLGSGQALSSLWQGPIQSRLNLLEAVLEQEAESSKSADKKRKLLAELEDVRAGALDRLPDDSRAFALLLDQEKFRDAAYDAMQKKLLLQRTGANAAGSLVNASLEHATGGLIADSGAATATATGVEAGISASTTVAQSVDDARGKQPERRSSNQPPSPLPHPPRRTSTMMSVGASVAGAVIDGATNMLDGVQKFGRFMTKGTYNVGMGLVSRPAYNQLLGTYRDASRFLKSEGGMATPPPHGTWKWQGQARPGT